MGESKLETLVEDESSSVSTDTPHGCLILEVHASGLTHHQALHKLPDLILKRTVVSLTHTWIILYIQWPLSYSG